LGHDPALNLRMETMALCMLARDLPRLSVSFLFP
jgi:hypothetical protein